MAKIGILGGAFNPPHIGHLLLAQAAYTELGLDRVVFIPANQPPHKEVSNEPGPLIRLELCRLAVESDDRFTVSSTEIDRGGISYSVDTLKKLKQENENDEFVLILGGDRAQSFPDWRHPEEILAMANLAVVEREASSRATITEVLSVFSSAHDRLQFLTMPRIDISSTLIREYVSSGRSIRYLVPDAVSGYIKDKGLYRP